MTLLKLMSKIELITDSKEITIGLIQDIVGDRIYVSMSSEDKRFKLLHKEDKVRCIVYDSKKVFGFDAIVLRQISGITPVYELLCQGSFKNIQRREYVRIKSSLLLCYTENSYLSNVNVEQLQNRGFLEDLKRYLKDGILSDISGGGLRFSSDEDLNVEKQLLLVLDLSNEIFVLRSEIIYKNVIITPFKKRYTYGVKFIDINENIREKIINYIFRNMRRNKIR